jgi:hypothetical protein
MTSVTEPETKYMTSITTPETNYVTSVTKPETKYMTIGTEPETKYVTSVTAPETKYITSVNEPETNYMTIESSFSSNVGATLVTTTTTTTTTMSLQSVLHSNTQEFSSLINLKSEHVTSTMDFLDVTSALGFEQNTYWSSGLTEAITRTINPSPVTKYATTATFSQLVPQIMSTMNRTSATEYVKPSISTSYRLQTNFAVIPTATATTIIWEQQFTIPHIPTESSTNLPETNERGTSDNIVIIIDLGKSCLCCQKTRQLKIYI